MLPILVTIGPVSIHSFGFFSALAFLIGSFLFWRLLKDEIPEDDLLIVSLLIGIFASLGARTLPALSSFFYRPTVDMFLRAFSSGNLSFWGAAIGGFIPIYIWQRQRIGRPWELVDPLGVIFLWVSSLVAIGVQLTGSWWGKQNSFVSTFGGRHPIGLYLSLWCFLGILLGLAIKRHYRAWSWYKSGKIGIVGLFSFGWFVLGFLVIATLSEKQLYWGPFAPSQILFLIVFVSILVATWKRAGRNFKELITWQPKRNLPL